tara:strand:+ start:195 stop:473 length:279 start_codon:yes stop_codon:yes gene_type:complete
LTKSDLIAKLTEKNDFLFQKDVYKIINIFFDTISNALENGDRFELRGFGTFGVKKRKARIGRNPKTGNPVSIPEKNIPFFKMGKGMRERINE